MSRSNIYTRKGDGGTTALFGGTRVSKGSTRIDTNGTIDEANAWIGLARSQVQDPLLADILEFVQHKIYNCTCCLADLDKKENKRIGIGEADVDFLERAIDRLEKETGPLTEFILPSGTPLAGMLHVARTVVRRAERQLVKLAQCEPADRWVLAFVNRLSDLLFAAARYANHIDNTVSTPWNNARAFPDLDGR